MKFFKYSFFLIFFFFLILFGINFYVKDSTKDQIKDINSVEEVDAIVVLGASIREDGSLSPMLRDRLVTGIEVFNKLEDTLIIMSGDHSTESYDEVTAMKRFALENSVNPKLLYGDDFGISTYDSIYRIKHIFKLKKIIIVTQKYHLYRALYIANKLGLEAIGVDATKKIYINQGYRDLREILARNKDFLKTIIKPSSTYTE